jgi:hypothetical protein
MNKNITVLYVIRYHNTLHLSVSIIIKNVQKTLDKINLLFIRV